MSLTEHHFFDFTLSSAAPRDMLESALKTSEATVFDTLNAHSFNVALRDETFCEALKDADRLVADGVGIVWAARAKGIRGVRKISGFDLFVAAMTLANENRLSVGFLGSTPDTLAKIQARAAREYPDVTVRVLSPPFRDAFAPSEAAELLNTVGPVDILCVGMTAPKQEKFVHAARSQIEARVVLSIGAVFDFYAGTTKRPHPVFIRLGLEWLGRSMADPRRLGRRNLIAIPTFLGNCLRLSFRREIRP